MPTYDNRRGGPGWYRFGWMRFALKLGSGGHGRPPPWKPETIGPETIPTAGRRLEVCHGDA
jgi:hypothetical protein